ncbi:DUF2511 domain-containing protein [Halomonas caseinilytica]|uniref:DUF2511 domain-containing protein n=1 Tax=Halomonas caseinilytica TaxID=438744 RepID=UPI0007E5B004|nr:DUF2511 domain-containing protein [Halomonas caseinilytica]SEM67324.1 Protein of unknown function [Halomonas caseinilytica]
MPKLAQVVLALVALFVGIGLFGYFTGAIDTDAQNDVATEQSEPQSQDSQSGSMPGVMVTASEYGNDWPFTVDSGRVDCKPVDAAVFTHDGTAYQLNGAASQRGYPAIDPLWRENPDIPGTKVSLGKMIDVALSQC